MKPVIPSSQQSYYDEWHYAPAFDANGFLFLSGATGYDPETDGYPEDIAEQIRLAFESLAEVLTEAGLGFEHVVDMTTYHVGLQSQLETFARIKDQFIKEPYPAWTAIGVSELASAGAKIEIKLIARRHDNLDWQ